MDYINPYFIDIMRMSPESFKYLLNLVGRIISKEHTRFRKAIPSAERLCLTLHYLAYGRSQQSLSFSFRIAKSTICSIIDEKGNRECIRHTCRPLASFYSAVEKTDRIVKATISLHNFLRQTNSAGYCPTGFVDSYCETGTIKEGKWRRLVGDNNGAALLQDIPPVRGSHPTTSAVEVRNMKSYVNSMEGSVPWQWDHVRSRGDILANENS